MPNDRIRFDHLSIGVRRWADGYERYARDLGGRWAHGGDGGEFAACQLAYRHDMRLELIAPSSPDGFMQRFIDHRGPGPHHLTFKVPSLERTLHDITGLGIRTLGGRISSPDWQEAFLHPKQAGVGTLIQLAQADDERLAARIGRPAPPDDFPELSGEPRTISWVALTVERIPAAEQLFVELLTGAVVERGERWTLITWDVGHNLLLREAGSDLPASLPWPSGDALGVGHVLFGRADLRVKDLDAVTVSALPPDKRSATLILLTDE